MNRLAICDSLYHCLALSEWMCEAGEGEELMIGIARGMAEIVERGRLGATRPHGTFSDLDLLEAIVAY